MRVVTGNIQRIEDHGSMYVFQIGYTSTGRVEASKDLFGKFFNKLPNVGDYVHFTVDEDNWTIEWEHGK